MFLEHEKLNVLFFSELNEKLKLIKGVNSQPDRRPRGSCA